jgi:hypothetical protein
MGCQKTTTKKMTAKRPTNLQMLPTSASGFHLIRGENFLVKSRKLFVLKQRNLERCFIGTVKHNKEEDQCLKAK